MASAHSAQGSTLTSLCANPPLCFSDQLVPLLSLLLTGFFSRKPLPSTQMGFGGAALPNEGTDRVLVQVGATPALTPQTHTFNTIHK